MNAAQAGTGFNNWYFSIPPITRYYATTIVVLTLASINLQFIPLIHIALLWPFVIKKLQIWRLVTNFFIIGKFNLNFVIRMLWIFTYVAPLEQQTYQFDPADFLFMMLFNATCILVPAYFLNFFFNGVPLLLSMVYVWSRFFPEQNVSLFGMVKIQSFYLPFAFAVLSLLLGDDIRPDIVGIVVGHCYYFLKELYPRTSGVTILKTPTFLKNMLADWGLGRPAATGPAGPAPSGFQAFRGSGRRLGTD